MMTYDQALAYWFGRINYEQTTPRSDDLKLERMHALLRLLGDPQERYRIVHVAGSKGKGSTSAMLAAILQQAGYRTGLFTSPHLGGVEERIQVDVQPISVPELTALLNEVEQVGRALAPQLTFFEISTALGFLHFARRRVETAVVEVGLGGRFDSTNVCTPTVAVVTSISYDHTALLGTSLASIAGEKAGIIKAGRPVVSGVTGPEARAVIERTCRVRRAPLWQLEADFRYSYQPGWVTADAQRPARVAVQTAGRSWPELPLGLLGRHQAANAAVTVACVERLRAAGLHIGDTAVAQGLAQVVWPARLEVLQRRPLVVLDCAHNVASVQALVDTLKESFPAQRRVLVLGSATDKDLAGMLQVLAPHVAHAVFTRFLSNPRSAAPEHLADLLRGFSDLPYTVCASPRTAWEAARALAGPDDLICITGSVFLAGEVRPLLGQAAPHG